MAAVAAIDELRLNVSLSAATSQFPGRWEELRDATLSSLDALDGLVMFRTWSLWGNITLTLWFVYTVCY